uniref:Uncharacterized protein n=1 Tax=Anopheles atroparvus TaxID=41427 RepID=A0AAG5DDQ5_ANOAO
MALHFTLFIMLLPLCPTPTTDEDHHLPRAPLDFNLITTHPSTVHQQPIYHCR